MATYKVQWAEVTKTGEKNGRPWSMTSMTLEDEAGKVTEKVSTFDAVSPGHTIEGEIIQNGQYLNFKKKLEVPAFIKKQRADVSASVEKAQEVKAKNIEAAQDRSAWMWAKTNASTLLAGVIKHGDYGSNTDIAEDVLDLATKIYNGEPNPTDKPPF